MEPNFEINPEFLKHKEGLNIELNKAAKKAKRQLAWKKIKRISGDILLYIPLIIFYSLIIYILDHFITKYW